MKSQTIPLLLTTRLTVRGERLLTVSYPEDTRQITDPKLGVLLLPFLVLASNENVSDQGRNIRPKICSY